MAVQIAAISALVGFAAAILLGLAAQNTFTTTLSRALAMMGGMFAVGLVIGAMAQRMAKESKTLKQGNKEKSSEEKERVDR